MTASKIGQMLVQHGLIDPCAIEDPEGYDNWRTDGQIRQFTNTLNAAFDAEEMRRQEAKARQEAAQ